MFKNNIKLINNRKISSFIKLKIEFKYYVYFIFTDLFRNFKKYVFLLDF